MGTLGRVMNILSGLDERLLGIPAEQPARRPPAVITERKMRHRQAVRAALPTSALLVGATLAMVIASMVAAHHGLPVVQHPQTVEVLPKGR